MNNYRVCRVCGKHYKACSYCETHSDFPSWRQTCCSIQCYVHRIPIIEYINFAMDKNEAKNHLKNADKTYGQINYCESIQKIVDKIMK